MDSEIVTCLSEMGFSPTEAKVYCTMVPEEKMNGYQIAKILGTSRSSVYAALETLLEKGAIVSIPGTTSEYAVVEPGELIDRSVGKFRKNAETARGLLESLSFKKRTSGYFANISGLHNLQDSLKAMIDSAEHEILFDTSMDLLPLQNEIREARKRGVRVILFSWINLNLYGMDIEFYCNDVNQTSTSEQRFSMVVDNRSCIIGSNDRAEFIPCKDYIEKNDSIHMSAEDEDFLGMKSDNRLIVNIIQEHIHFDIYLNKLRKKIHGEIITPDIQIQSLMETGFNK